MKRVREINLTSSCVYEVYVVKILIENYNNKQTGFAKELPKPKKNLGPGEVVSRRE